MSAQAQQIQRFLATFMMTALFALPVVAGEISADQFLDLDHYQTALDEIDKATDATLTEELADYMQTHSLAPHSALSRLSEEKFREWSERLVFGAPDTVQASAVTSEGAEPTRLKLQLDPLKERARLRIEGRVEGQIELSPGRQLVSVDLFENADGQMKLQYQHLSNPLGKQDQLQLRWHF